MTPVTIVGMIMGALVILTALAVFLSKKEFSPSGVAVTLVGLILIGMSQWSTIKITAAGATIDLSAVKEQVQQTAAAAAEVAGEVQQTAAAVDATRQQVSVLTTLLQARTAIPATDLERIRRTLEAAPRPDLSRLRTARTNLTAIKPTRP